MGGSRQGAMKGGSAMPMQGMGFPMMMPYMGMMAATMGQQWKKKKKKKKKKDERSDSSSSSRSSGSPSAQEEEEEVEMVTMETQTVRHPDRDPGAMVLVQKTVAP